MTFYSSHEAAYGAEHARIMARLEAVGVQTRMASTVASEILNEMRADGWRWSYREPAPAVIRGPVPAASKEIIDAWRERTAREIAAAEARWQVEAKGTPVPATEGVSA